MESATAEAARIDIRRKWQEVDLQRGPPTCYTGCGSRMRAFLGKKCIAHACPPATSAVAGFPYAHLSSKAHQLNVYAAYRLTERCSNMGMSPSPLRSDQPAEQHF